MTRRRWALVTMLLVAAIVFPLYWGVLSSLTPEGRLFARAGAGAARTGPGSLSGAVR